MKLKKPNMAPLMKVKAAADQRRTGRLSTASCAPSVFFSGSMEGMNRSVPRKPSPFTAAKKSIAAEKEVWDAMKLVTGTPRTMPAETPTKTFADAFGAMSFGTAAAAAVNAMETYTGWRKAGSARAASTTANCSAAAETRLAAVKRPSAASITFFLSNREKKSGITGAESATIPAKILTVHPASGTVTPKVSAMSGMIPTTPISVLMMPKTPKVSSSTSSCPSVFSFSCFIESPFCLIYSGRSIPGNFDDFKSLIHMPSILEEHEGFPISSKKEQEKRPRKGGLFP